MAMQVQGICSGIELRMTEAGNIAVVGVSYFYICGLIGEMSNL